MDKRRDGVTGSSKEVRAASDEATTQRWEIDAARSTLTFSLRHIVVQRIRGRFDRWGGTLFLDRRDPWLSSVDVWVDLASITTDDPERDAQVRSDEFLDVARFGRAEFKSTAVDLRGVEVVIEGLLDLHGVVHDVEIRANVGPMTIGDDGRERNSYTARGTIDRQSFGLHWNQDLDVGGVVVGDDVDIVAKLELVRTDARTQSATASHPATAG
jgi:polyisoprenoid-binding protein YceI